MIPSARLLLIASIGPFVVLVGNGTTTSLVLGWAVLASALVLFVVDAWLAGQLRKQVDFRRIEPGRLYVEQPQKVEWVVQNRSIQPVRLLLRDRLPESGQADPPQFAQTVPPRLQQTLSYDLVVTRRGELAFDRGDCRICGPLGFAWRQFRVGEPRPIRSLPHLANWAAAEVAAHQALARQVGSHRYRWRGAGTMFESLREYSSEDDIRWIDWKATARMQRPITRNYEIERHQQVLLLVDSSRMMTTHCGRRTKFDAVLEAAVLLSQMAIEQADSVGLLLFSDRIDAYLAPRRSRQQASAVMELLGGCYPRLVEPDYESALGAAAHRNQRRSLIVLFTDVTVIESARRMLAYVRAIGHRHLCVVATIADESLLEWELREPQSDAELYRVGVVSDLLLRRAEILEGLRQSGAEIVDSPADQIAAETITRYLELKRHLRI